VGAFYRIITGIAIFSFIKIRYYEKNIANQAFQEISVNEE